MDRTIQNAEAISPNLSGRQPHTVECQLDPRALTNMPSPVTHRKSMLMKVGRCHTVSNRPHWMTAWRIARPPRALHPWLPLDWPHGQRKGSPDAQSRAFRGGRDGQNPDTQERPRPPRCRVFAPV